MQKKTIAHHQPTDAQPVPKKWQPLPTSTPSAFIAEHDPVWCGISLWSVGVSCPKFLCNPSLLAGRAVWEAEKALTLCKYCSAVTKTSQCYQHHFHHKSET